MYTQGGKWRHDGELWTNWCEGFLPGMMWIFHRRTGDPWWREQAERYTRPLEERQHDRNVHDLNFVLGSSFGRWYELTGEEHLRQVLINGGRTMALRFREPGRYLRSFVADESCFIDIMMNVGILYFAARESGDAELRRKVDAHCVTTRRYLVRGDGSTAHEGVFDLDTGEFVRQSTHQGYRGDSCWVRGLAWSLYGFGTAYSYTGDERFLHTAECNARCLLERLPEDGVTPYDFDAPDGQRPPDTSGSAIAVGGLQQLADLTPSPERAAEYRAAAYHLLNALCRPPYLASETPGWEGILREQVYHLRLGLGVGESCMFGDHFFVEALAKALDALDASPEPSSGASG
ncbi:MAG: glycoside hydrolase family 88 protein [Armatimonadetes bacterium]|nr:glycoside hydrolase family 88 protein [Armatimonadota bacterium]